MLGLLGGFFGLAGSAMSLFGGMQQSSGQQHMSQALQEEEDARHQQMTLDYQRARIETVRNAAISASMGRAAAANQGASFSSSEKTGESSLTNEAAYGVRNANQNEQVGGEIFKARTDYYTAGGQISQGQGISSLGNAIAGSASNLASFGTNLLSRFSTPSSGGSAMSSSSNPPVNIGALY